MLKLIETLINEHGSSTILKERLGLISAEYTTLERQRDDLQLENTQLKSQLSDMQNRLSSLNHELSQLKNGQLATYLCDHCGSSDIKRTGSRPHPIFGDSGIKEKLFTCNICNKESAFIPEDL